MKGYIDKQVSHGNRYLSRLAGVWKKYGSTTCNTLTSLLVRFLQQRKMFNNKAIRKAKSFKRFKTIAKQQVLSMVGIEDQDINDSPKILADAISYRNEANATTERGIKVISFVCN